MRRLSTIVLAAALATPVFAATANATEVTTCVVVIGASAGPGGASVDKVEVRSVGDCL